MNQPNGKSIPRHPGGKTGAAINKESHMGDLEVNES